MAFPEASLLMEVYRFFLTFAKYHLRAWRGGMSGL
ncbi:hypothetical protein CGMCC3_g16650 [Colletotrichum fructicola]|nr:uncharacterized protein CGMCC3_g16650 [Colletotrichum fructicola]KAE9567192.1 hypothetical protein CGMCC3_g16650 [Colletotrichum fructicola]